MTRLQRWGIPLFLFIMGLSVRIWHLGGFVTVDEPRWMERSAKFTSGLLFSDYQCPPERDGRQFEAVGLACTYQAGYPGVTTTWSASLGFLAHYLWSVQPQDIDLASYLANIKLRELDQSLIVPARIGGAVVNAIFIPVFYLLVLRLFSWRLAFVASLLVALGPFYIALSRVLHHDALTTTFMVVALLSMIGYWLRQWRLRWLVISGIAAGLGFLTKPVAWYMAPCAAMIGGLSLIYGWWGGNQQGWKAVKRLIRDGLLWCGVTALTCFVLFPALWVIPIETVSGIVALTSQFAEEGHINGQYFWGEVYNDPGMIFYPLGWLLQTSPFEVIGLLLMPAAAWFSFKAQERKSLGQFIRQHPVQVALLLFLVSFLLFLNVSNKKFIRYFLPAFPILSIFAAFGLLWPIEALRRAGHGRYWRRALFPALAGTILVGQGMFIFQHVPYYFTYYNPLFGDNRAAAQFITIYGWGDQMRRVADYLNRQPNAEALRVVAWYNIALQPFFVGKAHDFSSQPGNVMDSEYVVYHVNQLQRQMQDEAIWQYFSQHHTPAERIRFDNLDYALIYRNPIAHHVDWEKNSLEDTFTFFGYSLQPAGQITLYWQNLGVPAGQSLWVGLVPATGAGLTSWAKCTPAPNFTASATIAGAIVESECQLRAAEPGMNVYHLQLGLGNELASISSINFPAGQLAIVVDAGGEFAVVGREAGLAVLAQQLLPAQASPLNILFGDIARLVGYQQQADGLTLYWQPTEKLNREFAQAFEVELQLEAEPSATVSQPLLANFGGPVVPNMVTAITYPVDSHGNGLKVCIRVAANRQPVFGMPADGSAAVECLAIPAAP